MQKLNFSSYDFQFKKLDDKLYIFDIIRKKYYVLTPEEWVRQHTLHYLIYDKKYPATLIAVEKQLTINDTKRRFDIVVFDKMMQAHILVECKAPQIELNQTTFDQANQYNWLLKAPFLFLTNGLQHITCQIDILNNNYRFLKELPVYK